MPYCEYHGVYGNLEPNCPKCIYELSHSEKLKLKYDLQTQLQRDIEDEIERYIAIQNKKIEQWCLERSSNPMDFEKRIDPKTGKWSIYCLKTGETYENCYMV